jgi:hypothetical protein
MTVNTHRLAVLIGTLLLVEYGCALNTYRAYEGPERPHDQIAVIKLAEGVFVVEVDNKATDLGAKYLTTYDPAPEVHFLPGEHTMRIRYSYSGPGPGVLREMITSHGRCKFRFYTRAGDRYLVYVYIDRRNHTWDAALVYSDDPALHWFWTRKSPTEPVPTPPEPRAIWNCHFRE